MRPRRTLPTTAPVAVPPSVAIVTAPHHDRAPVVPGRPVAHHGRVGVRVVRWGQNVGRCRDHNGWPRGHHRAEEGKADPEGEVNPSAGHPWRREQRNGQYPGGKRSLRHTSSVGPANTQGGAVVAGREPADGLRANAWKLKGLREQTGEVHYRSEQEEVVPAGSGDLEGALGGGLAADVG